MVGDKWLKEHKYVTIFLLMAFIVITILISLFWS